MRELTPEQREQLIADCVENADAVELLENYGTSYIEQMAEEYGADLKRFSDQALLVEYEHVVGPVPEEFQEEVIVPDPDQTELNME